MTYIYVTETTTQYPYSLWDLREREPNVSFPVSPAPADLAPFGVFPVTPTPPPDVNPRTERLVEGEPMDRGDGTWAQTWTVLAATPEEIAAWDAANPPAPDWSRFKGALLMDAEASAALAAALPVVPSAVLSLPAALMNAASGSWADFRAAWLVLRRMNCIPDGIAARTATLAADCNLPEGFRAFLGGGDAGELGQPTE